MGIRALMTHSVFKKSLCKGYWARKSCNSAMTNEVFRQPGPSWNMTHGNVPHTKTKQTTKINIEKGSTVRQPPLFLTATSKPTVAKHHGIHLFWAMLQHVARQIAEIHSQYFIFMRKCGMYISINISLFNCPTKSPGHNLDGSKS